MNIRERAIHLVVIWMKAGRREAGELGRGGGWSKSEESVQKRDRASSAPLGGSGKKKKNEKDR